MPAVGSRAGLAVDVVLPDRCLGPQLLVGRLNRRPLAGGRLEASIGIAIVVNPREGQMEV